MKRIIAYIVMATLLVFSVASAEWDKDLWEKKSDGSIGPINESKSVAIGSANYNPLIAAMEAGQSVAISALGDSTIVGNDDWFYLFLQDLGVLYPDYTIKYHLWTDADGSLDDADVFAVPATIQSGAGGERRMSFASNSTLAASIADGEIAEITGDFDVRVCFVPENDDWTPASQMTVSGHWGIGGDVSWQLYITTSGNCYFDYSTDGTATLSQNAGPPIPDTGATPQCLRVTLDIDNGASGHDVTFYTAAYGSDSWSAYGPVDTVAGVFGGLYNSTAPWKIGMRGTVAGGQPFHGDIYSIEIRDGIDSPTVLNPMNISAWKPEQSQVALSGGPQLDVINGSRTGADLAYTGDASRLPRLLKNYEQILTIIAIMHGGNDSGDDFGYTDWITPYSSLIDDIKTNLPLSDVVITTQNPRYSPATNIDAHAIRRIQLMSWADQTGIKLIDTYGAYVANGGSSLVAADGIHPIASGNEVQKNAVKQWALSGIPR